MFAIFNAELARLDALDGNGSNDHDGYALTTDWLALFNNQSDAEWLVTDFWPVGRQIHLHAARKQGKSLVTLWIACNLANGRDPFNGNAIPPVRVGYFDFEMTEADLRERLLDMGFTPETLINLYYFMYPAIPMLDTEAGGKALLGHCLHYGLQAVIIDTMSRVVAGDENSNDTYIRFYKHTGALLKAHGISLFRLDHEGHLSGRSRGASAKADDVDIVWQLRQMDNGGYQLVRTAARISWIPENVLITMVEEPCLSFERVAEAWPAGTAEKAKELDACGATIDVSKRQATEMLREHGFVPGKATILLAAIRFRKWRFPGV